MLVTTSWYPFGTPWDYGISWRVERGAPSDWLISAADVNEMVLRNVNDGADDAYVASCIRAAIDMAEEYTFTTIAPRTLTLIMSGFPSGPIVLPYPPLRSVGSIGYLDSDGAPLTLSGSPAEYQLSGSGRYGKASLLPLSGASWPTPGEYADAVTISYEAGYETQDEIPPSILHGIYAVVAEMYKIRGLSVQPSSSSVPAELKLDRFWPRRF